MPDPAPTPDENSAPQQTMLLAFDGSHEAKRALQYAARLLSPGFVEILTAWEPVHRQAARNAGTAGMHQGDWSSSAEADDPAYAAARAICYDGVDLAESLGLRARAHLVESATSTWSAILDACRELRPDVIVTGSRGISGLRSLWRNSTSEALIKNGDIPVFIVPRPEEDDDNDQDQGQDQGQTIDERDELIRPDDTLRD